MRVPNYYASPGFERAGLRRRETAWIIERVADPASLFVPVWRNHNLVVEIDGGEPRAIALGWEEVGPLFGDRLAAEERLKRGEIVFLGIIAERAHFALDLSSAAEAPLAMLRSPAQAAGGGELHFTDLRRIGAVLDRHDGALLAHARAMLFWHSRHRFCGICGSRTRVEEAGHQRHCINPQCDALHFPRTDPAVIMLVIEGDRALLGRNKNFPVSGMY